MQPFLRAQVAIWIGICCVLSCGADKCAAQIEITDDLLRNAKSSFEEHRGKEVHFEVLDGQKTPEYADRTKPFQAGPMCGPNSLYAVCRILDLNCEYEEITKLLPVGMKGCSLADIYGASKTVGLSTELRKDVTPEQLIGAPKPIIVHLKSQGTGKQELESLDHFTVLTDYRSDKDLFYCIDTTNCVYTTIPTKAISRAMSGYCLVVTGQEFTAAGSPTGFWLACCALICALGANVFVHFRSGRHTSRSNSNSAKMSISAT